MMGVSMKLVDRRFLMCAFVLFVVITWIDFMQICSWMKIFWML